MLCRTLPVAARGEVSAVAVDPAVAAVVGLGRPFMVA